MGRDRYERRRRPRRDTAAGAGRTLNRDEVTRALTLDLMRRWESDLAENPVPPDEAEEELPF